MQYRLVIQINFLLVIQANKCVGVIPVKKSLATFIQQFSVIVFDFIHSKISSSSFIYPHCSKKYNQIDIFSNTIAKKGKCTCESLVSMPNIYKYQIGMSAENLGYISILTNNQKKQNPMENLISNNLCENGKRSKFNLEWCV